MAVALVLDGVPELQQCVADGLDSLRALLADRHNRGCTITPVTEATMGVEYRIEHPDAATEVAYLTDYPDPDNEDWDPG